MFIPVKSCNLNRFVLCSFLRYQMYYRSSCFHRYFKFGRLLDIVVTNIARRVEVDITAAGVCIGSEKG